jgi:transposase
LPFCPAAGLSNALSPGFHRRLSRDYERSPKTSEAFIYIAMARIMLP